MSIEQKLKQEYKSASESLHLPSSLETHMTAIIAEQGAKWREGKPMIVKRKFTARKWIYAALIAAVLSGFGYATQKLLFQSDHGFIQTEVWTDSGFKLAPSLKTDIRSTLADVKNQLQEGQYAAVYMAALEKSEYSAFRQHPLLSVSKPRTVEQLEQWSDKIASAGISSAVPDQLNGAFTFESGKSEPAFGGIVSLEGLEMLGELRQESKDQGKAYTWRTQPKETNPPVDIYTSTYKSADGNRLFVQYDHILEKVKIKAISPDTIVHDRIQKDGIEADYVENNDYLFSDTGLYKELSWMSKSSSSVMIRVITDSPNISKEQLIQAAQAVE
ncbi:hypothetical protein MH117_12350 [Paenibacillus sp. ACRRX]|uniref:hypothetical protein n=1 Tax=Paenibacillus sp. ACRRX TaxID=2918206 RepID=UPI001EF40A6F|nr:hypothetical protein [Paenibacillus sp. ACRRX]MCG7408214.1 hypothetical protein [Paenibacillus sp. ACRRX]